MLRKVKKSKKSVPQADPEDLEQELEEDELEAEMRAVMEIRNSKQNDQNDTITNSVTNTHYNKNGLVMANSNHHVPTLPFVETLQISKFDLNHENENDDIEREMAFYNHTLLAVKLGREQLEAFGIPTRRPTDYFCEHVKSDGHMSRIKDKLILEEKKIKSFEQRKQQDIARKYEREIAENKRKLKELNAKKQGNQDDDEDENEDDLDGLSPFKKKRKKNDNDDQLVNKALSSNNTNKKGFPEKSKKRINMDKKYGSGIKQKMKAKLNDKKSLNDLSQFNPRGGKFIRGKGGPGGSGFKVGRGGGGGGTGGGKNKPNRPGKEARKQKRTNNRSK